MTVQCETCRERAILSAFDKGQAESRKGGSSSRNPFMPVTERELYDAWAAGFEWEEGPRYVMRPLVVLTEMTQAEAEARGYV